MKQYLKASLIGWALWACSVLSGCDGRTISLEPDAGVEHDLILAQRRVEDSIKALDAIRELIIQCYKLPIDPAECDKFSVPYADARAAALDADHALQSAIEADQAIKDLVR